MLPATIRLLNCRTTTASSLKSQVGGIVLINSFVRDLFEFYCLVSVAVIDSQMTVITVTCVAVIGLAVLMGSLFVLRACSRRRKEMAARRKDAGGELEAQRQSLLAAGRTSFETLRLISIAGT